MSQEELVTALEKEKQDMNDVPFKASILRAEKKTESFFEHNFAEGDTKLIDLSPLAANPNGDFFPPQLTSGDPWRQAKT